MNKLQRLFARKSELEAYFSKRKSERIEAERALVLVAKLETQLPLQIETFKSEPVDIAFSEDSRSLEDFHNSGALAHQANVVESIERLIADLPTIKKHWLARQAELAD